MLGWCWHPGGRRQGVVCQQEASCGCRGVTRGHSDPRMTRPGAVGTTPTRAGSPGIQESSCSNPSTLPKFFFFLPLFSAPGSSLTASISSLLPSSATPPHPASLFPLSFDLLSSDSLAGCPRRSGFLGSCLPSSLPWEDSSQFQPHPWALGLVLRETV